MLAVVGRKIEVTMFIQTEATPNPATLKFLPGREVMGTGAANFTTVESAKRSPLATSLFTVEGVSGVFLGGDFITVTNSGDKDWETLKPQILGSIMDHFSSDKPVISEEAASTDNADEDGVVTQIKELLDTRVRPAVAQDGGDIVFHGFEDGIVYLEMHGACAGCPSSSATLKHGIENMLKYYVPEVEEVRPYEG